MMPTPKSDFVPLGAGHTHDLILLEWTTKDPVDVDKWNNQRRNDARDVSIGRSGAPKPLAVSVGRAQRRPLRPRMAFFQTAPPATCLSR
jgi:hypothetical protein